MKLNKKIIKLFIITVFCILFMPINDVKAQLYNGTGGTVLGGSGYGSCGSQSNCLYNNSRMIILKITLYYIDNGNFSQNGKSFYWTNDYGHNFLKSSYNDVYYFPDLNECTSKKDKYSCASAKVRNYFGEAANYEVTAGAKKTINFMLNRGNFDDASDYYKSVLTNTSELANRTTAASKGYRIIIEPVLNIKNVKMKDGRKGRVGILTVKELAQTTNGTSCKQSGTGCGGPLLGSNSLAQYLFTDFLDVGISNSSKSICEGINQEQLADTRNGCGYNIVDISQYSNSKKCYTRTVEVNNPKCINTDQNNNGNYSEIYTERSCDDASAEEETNTKYGKLIATDNNDCKIYCKESANVSFPGNVSKAIALEMIPTKGSYFAWPSRRYDPTGRYSMSMSTSFTCKIVKSSKSCNTEKLINSAKSKIINSDTAAKLTAGTNNKIDENLTIDSKEITTKEDIGGYTNSISNNDLIFTKKVYFKIGNNRNRYFNKSSLKVTDSVGEINSNIYDRKEGVISLKENDSTNNKYSLTISNIKLGTGNIFGNEIKEDYVCYYRIARDSCVCPEGTLKAGTSLYEEMTAGKTCAELIETKCNVCECPPDSAREKVGIVLLSGDAATEEACSLEQNRVCYTGYCREDSDEFKDCVTEKTLLGYTDHEAKKSCENAVCSTCTYNGETYDLSDCMELGNTYKTCYRLYCSDDICVDDICEVCSDDCKWQLKSSATTNTTKISYVRKCSDGENCDKIDLFCPGGETNMQNPLPCVQSKLGVSDITSALNSGIITPGDVDSAFAACESTVCPIGNKIIYRVIDLDNPFPGKENEGIFTKFSNSGRGRKPGNNWNSTTLVKNKILQARGANGYELYNKEPLYVITLTPSDMKEIRKYNKQNKYSNFDMNCTNNSKSAKCISNFLHKEFNNILTSGKCRNMTNSTDFDKCYNGK